MSKITKITPDNFLYFDGLLENRFFERKKDEMFVGLIDDEETAVSIAVFSVFEDGFTLRFVATDPDKENRGYATQLIGKTLEAMSDSTFEFCQAVFYGELEEKEQAVKRILEKNGFVSEELPVYRSIYKLSDFAHLRGKSEDTNVVVKKATELNETEYLSLLELEKEYRGTSVYMDAEEFSNDKYCMCAVKNGRINALAHGKPIDEGFIVDTVIAKNQNVYYLSALFEAMERAVASDFSQDISVYIDSSGDKLYEYQEKIVGAAPKEKLIAKRYVKKL